MKNKWIWIVLLMLALPLIIPFFIKKDKESDRFDIAMTYKGINQVDYLMNETNGPFVKIQGYVYKDGYPLEYYDDLYKKNKRMNAKVYGFNMEYREDLREEYKWAGFNTSIYLRNLPEDKVFIPKVKPISKKYTGKGVSLPYDGEEFTKYDAGYAYTIKSINGVLGIEKRKDDQWQVKLDNEKPKNPQCEYYAVELATANKQFELKHCVEDLAVAKQKMKELNNTPTQTPVIRGKNGVILDMATGIVDFSSLEEKSIAYIYLNKDSNEYEAYTNGAYGNVAGFIQSDLGITNRIQMKIANRIGWVKQSIGEQTIKLVPESQIQDYFRSMDYYKVDPVFSLKHYINYSKFMLSDVNAFKIGKAPLWMEPETKYYSLDGIYFYDNLHLFLSDTKNQTNKFAINIDKPYYNYYQYLSIRSKTNYTAEDFNKYLKLRGYKDISKLYKQGEAFIESQEENGVNAAMEFAWAIHESGFGLSKISKEKNNLFGMGAYDSNPFSGAIPFENLVQGINYHAKTYISKGYTNALSDLRYFGSHLGNKSSGMNVKYASDPYWSEKIAGKYYDIDRKLGLKDYNYYTIALKKENQIIDVYYTKDTTQLAYQSKQAATNTNIEPYTFLVIGKKGDWLEIMGDMPIKNNEKEQCSDVTFNTQTGIFDLVSHDDIPVNQVDPYCNYDLKHNSLFIKNENIIFLNEQNYRRP